MTDRELVLQLLATMSEHVRRARRRRDGDLEAFRDDVDRQDSMALSLLVAAQEAVDVAFHICTDECWGVPASYSDAFSVLSDHRVIDAALAEELRRVVGVRNRIAHLYGTVDVERLWTELPAGLDALDRYAAAIAKYLGEPPR